MPPRLKHTSAAAGLALVIALPLSAQCPDGTPRPCARAVVHAVAPPPGSVAVLYFQTRDGADAYLADGLTEDVTTLLARRLELVVKPSSSVRLAQRRNPDGSTSTLGRALAVHYVVQASLRRLADGVRLNVQLVDAGSDVTVWGDSYDRTAGALLTLPAELARVVAERVTLATIGRQPPPLSSGGPRGPAQTARPTTVWKTTNPAALDHFRRGNYLLAQRVNVLGAFAEYQEAARLDPLFADALARSAYALGIGRERQINAPLRPTRREPPDSLLAQGLALANAALRLDSTTSDAWMALGYLRALADLKTLAGAEQAFQRALTLDSLNAEGWHQYAQILMWLGDDVGTVRALERAVAIEPARASSLSSLAYQFARDPARSLALSDSALAISPDMKLAQGARGMALLALRRPAEALRYAETLPGSMLAVRVGAYLALGDSARARQIAARWLPPNANGAAVGAQVALEVGDTTWALEHLERIPPAERDANLWMKLRGPDFDALRGDPRFQRVYQDARPVGARAP